MGLTRTAVVVFTGALAALVYAGPGAAAVPASYPLVGATSVVHFDRYAPFGAIDPLPFDAPTWEDGEALVDPNALLDAKGMERRAAAFTSVPDQHARVLDTRVRLGFDDHHRVYIIFDCDQSTADIVARTLINDVDLDGEDYVQVQVASGANGSRAQTFTVTPAGTRRHSAKGGGAGEGGWSAQARIIRDDAGKTQGWKAKLIIPASMLRLDSKSRHDLRVNFVRHVAAEHALYSWSYDKRMQDDPGADARWWPLFKNLRLRTALKSYGTLAPIYRSGGSRPGLEGTVPTGEGRRVLFTLYPDLSNLESTRKRSFSRDFARADFACTNICRNFQDRIGVFGRPVSADLGIPYEFGIDNRIVDAGAKPFRAIDQGMLVEQHRVHSLGLLSINGVEPGGKFSDLAFTYSIVPVKTRAAATGIYVTSVSSNHTYGHTSTAEIAVNTFNDNSNLGGFFAYGTSFAPGARSVNGVALWSNADYIRLALGWKDTTADFAAVDGNPNVNDSRGPIASVHAIWRPASDDKPLRRLGVGATLLRTFDQYGQPTQIEVATGIKAWFAGLHILEWNHATSGAQATFINDRTADGTSYIYPQDFDRLTYALRASASEQSRLPPKFSISLGAGHQSVCHDGDPACTEGYLHLVALEASTNCASGLALIGRYSHAQMSPVDGARDGQSTLVGQVGYPLAHGASAFLVAKKVVGKAGFEGQTGASLAGILDLRIGRDNLLVEIGNPNGDPFAPELRTLRRVFVKYRLGIGDRPLDEPRRELPKGKARGIC